MVHGLLTERVLERFAIPSSSNHVWTWELDPKESWAPKSWCFWIVVLEKTLESPLNSKEIKPVNPKGNQAWICIRRTDAEAEVSILGSPEANRWLTGKDPDAGKDWGWEKRVTEGKMVGWHHWFNGHEFEQALGKCEGQGSLACCSPWGLKELDVTWWLNNNNNTKECKNHGVWVCVWWAVVGCRWGQGEEAETQRHSVYWFAFFNLKTSRSHLSPNGSSTE